MNWFVPFAVILPFALALLIAGSGRRAVAVQQSRHLAELERKLDLIMAHLGIREPEPEAPDAVLQELMAGRKIQAIKLFREATGAGLKEAKHAVELLARQRGLR
ncbi:ribosomal protein L7/L12 [Dactylosporangium roseum]|uniref:Ribosomal protein L7/L12 n=1 Tax=Dactylosporangium roseum TaxID=47989 RepID=A0ABY5Z1M8_9ACTN|nr:ribosomal protein L7/L12 [Dactylosporangium roseum]UWZ34653.1 ribosomal protein L7/L12 [Dactylosporangium roseum]